MEMLTALHDKFYTPPVFAELKQEVNDAHQQLIARLEKPERKLVLQIIDAQNQMNEDVSVDSFVSGLKLGMQLSEELKYVKINDQDIRSGMQCS